MLYNKKEKDRKHKLEDNFNIIEYRLIRIILLGSF